MNPRQTPNVSEGLTPSTLAFHALYYSQDHTLPIEPSDEMNEMVLDPATYPKER